MLFDLKSGASKSIAVPDSHGLMPLAAAPNGYIAAKVGEASGELYRVRWSGKTSSIGQPFSDGRPSVVTSGGAGFVAYGQGTYTTSSGGENDSGGVVASLFDKPRRYVPLAPLRQDRGCGAPSTSYVACAYDSSPGHPERVYKLSGGVASESSLRTSSQCSTRLPTNLHRSAFWIGCKRKVLFELNHGRVTHSHETFADATPIRAFGRVVVTSTNRKHLLSLASVSGPVKQLAVN
jgi:hypothetical protein